MTTGDLALSFAHRLRANADHAERSKFSVCNLSTMKIEEARALADILDAARAPAPAQEPVAAAAPVSPPTESGEELTADFAQSLPGGKLDDSTYSKIEDALDRIDAPMTGDDGRWLSLHERIAALAPPPADHRRVQDAAPARPELDALIAEAKAQAPQPGGVVKVKALEWRDGPPYSGQQVADCVFGEYWAWDAGSGCWSRGSLPGTLVSGGMKGAKAAAQADYERRILSALEPSPSGWDAGAFEAGAKAMRGAIVARTEDRGYLDVEEIMALPLPTPPAGEG